MEEEIKTGEEKQEELDKEWEDNEEDDDDDEEDEEDDDDENSGPVPKGTDE